MWHQHQDIKQWRYLRHFTAVTVAPIAKNGYGVADLLKLDYMDFLNKSNTGNNDGDFHCGIRLPDGAEFSELARIGLLLDKYKFQKWR